MHLTHLKHRGMWFAALLTSLLAATPGFAEPLLNARQGWRVVDEAKSAMVAGDESRANALALRVLEQKTLPSRLRAEALLTRCASTVRLGRYGEALAECERAEAIGGRSWRIDGIRGMAHLARGDADRAVAAFQSALRADRNPPILRRGLREALRARRRGEEARGGYALDLRLTSLVQ